MVLSPPLDVFWVRESLLYPHRAELEEDGHFRAQLPL